MEYETQLVEELESQHRWRVERLQMDQMLGTVDRATDPEPLEARPSKGALPSA